MISLLNVWLYFRLRVLSAIKSVVAFFLFFFVAGVSASICLESSFLLKDYFFFNLKKKFNLVTLWLFLCSIFFEV